MTRVTFTAGRRGRAELFARDQVLRGLATQFSCGPAEVPAAIEKLRRTAETNDTELANLRSKLAALTIAQFGDAPRVVATIPGDAELVRSIAAKLSAAGRDALLAAPDGEGLHVVLFRAPGSTMDCGALFKQLAARAGGRGGGKAERAEGRLATAIDWTATLSDLI
jgi:alanyl-tRNA synthetase